ncbi:hypothetical protein LCGC14_2166420, partial [marine sediment metagenome]
PFPIRAIQVDGGSEFQDAFERDDQALYDRLVVNEQKIDGMIQALREVRDQDDPVNQEISNRTLNTGLEIINRTAPFGTIMIIYESRPDVTIEAAVLAFKGNNKIQRSIKAIESNCDLWMDFVRS